MYFERLCCLELFLVLIMVHYFQSVAVVLRVTTVVGGPGPCLSVQLNARHYLDILVVGCYN